MKLETIEEDESSRQTTTPELSTKEIQDRLFDIWFKSTVLNGPKRRQYKIPFRILSLPCGCCRTRTNETDPNNIWFIKRKGSKYSHKECGTVINENS